MNPTARRPAIAATWIVRIVPILAVVAGLAYVSQLATSPAGESATSATGAATATTARPGGGTSPGASSGGAAASSTGATTGASGGGSGGGSSSGPAATSPTTIAGGTVSTPRPPGSGPTTPSPEVEERVAVLDPLIEALTVGAQAGPGTSLGVVSGLVSVAVTPLTDLPGGRDLAALLIAPLGQLQGPAAEFRDAMVDALQSLSDSIDPLAALSPSLDSALSDAADRLDEAAARYGEDIAPLDVLLVFYADTLRSFRSS